MKKFVFNTAGVRVIDDPVIPGAKEYVAYVPVDGFPTGIPIGPGTGGPNPRDPMEKANDVGKGIADSLADDDVPFHPNSRGGLIIASAIQRNGDQLVVELNSNTYPPDGIGDGGGTVTRIWQDNVRRAEKGEPPSPHFVKMIFRTGYSQLQKFDMVECFNISNQVKDISSLNLRGAFDTAKAALPDRVSEKIAYVESDQNKKYKVAQLLQAMLAVNSKRFPTHESSMPSFYSSTQKLLDDFEKNPQYYDPMYALLPEIMRLAETISFTAIGLGQISARQKEENISSLADRRERGNHEPVFTDYEPQPNRAHWSATLLLLNAMRVLVVPDKKSNGKELKWDRPFSKVLDFWHENNRTLSTTLINKSRSKHSDSPVLTAKEHDRWEELFLLAQIAKTEKRDAS